MKIEAMQYMFKEEEETAVKLENLLKTNKTGLSWGDKIMEAMGM